MNDWAPYPNIEGNNPFFYHDSRPAYLGHEIFHPGYDDNDSSFSFLQISFWEGTCLKLPN